MEVNDPLYEAEDFCFAFEVNATTSGYLSKILVSDKTTATSCLVFFLEGTLIYVCVRLRA